MDIFENYSPLCWRMVPSTTAEQTDVTLERKTMVILHTFTDCVFTMNSPIIIMIIIIESEWEHTHTQDPCIHIAHITQHGTEWQDKLLPFSFQHYFFRAQFWTQLICFNFAWYSQLALAEKQCKKFNSETDATAAGWRSKSCRFWAGSTGLGRFTKSESRERERERATFYLWFHQTNKSIWSKPLYGAWTAWINKLETWLTGWLVNDSINQSITIGLVCVCAISLNRETGPLCA